MPVSVETTCPEAPVPCASITRTVNRVLRGEGRGGAHVTIVFVDDAHIRRLNQQYRRQDRATDVLSFGLDAEGTPDGGTLGDVYVSLDRARAQAVRYRVDLADEVTRLVVHGCLHLLGYDHQTERDRRVMRRKEAGYLVESRTYGVKRVWKSR